MEVEPGDVGVGLMVTGFGFAGLFLAAGAQDDAMYLFGLGLVGFAFAFVLGLIRRHYDRVPIAAEWIEVARPPAPITSSEDPMGAAALALVAASSREKAAAHV